MRVVLCTGMSGSGRRTCLSNIVQTPPPPDYQWMLLDVGDMMFDLDQPNLSKPSNECARNVWEDAVLKRITSLNYQRSAAHQCILSEVEKAREQEQQRGTQKAVIISTHAMFHYNNSRLRGFESRWLTDLNPDFFVTIIDDVLNVRRRLRASGQQRWTDMATVTLLDWREEEHFITHIMASFLGREHFLVPKRRSAKILYDLVFYPEKVPIYLSYPMTFVQHYPEVRERVQRLEEELSQWFVVFDPFDVRDLEYQEKLFEDIRQEYGVKGRELSSHEEEQIRHHLGSQTVARDHTLIDQCCGIVVYYPALRFEGRESKGVNSVEEIPPFSSGVLDEISYATELGKKVYLIWTAKHSPGPFLDARCDVRVGSSEELVSILRDEARNMSRTMWNPSIDLTLTRLEYTPELYLS